MSGEDWLAMHNSMHSARRTASTMVRLVRRDGTSFLVEMSVTKGLPCFVISEASIGLNEDDLRAEIICDDAGILPDGARIGGLSSSRAGVF